MKGWFVTGTDTGVGKTYVAAMLLRGLAARGLRAAGFKPVATGCRATPEGLRSGDAEILRAASNVRFDYAESNTHAFELPIAPHLAARQLGVRLDARDLAARCRAFVGRCDAVIVEGIGGWLVPLNDTESVADLARLLGLPVVVVVGLKLGCINHALLTFRAVREAGLPLAGWVANEVVPETAEIEGVIETIKRRVEAPLLGRVPYAPAQSISRLESLLDLSGLLSS